jgi:hypothetical protein
MKIADVVFEKKGIVNTMSCWPSRIVDEVAVATQLLKTHKIYQQLHLTSHRVVMGTMLATKLHCQELVIIQRLRSRKSMTEIVTIMNSCDISRDTLTIRRMEETMERTLVSRNTASLNNGNSGNVTDLHHHGLAGQLQPMRKYLIRNERRRETTDVMMTQTHTIEA